MDKSKGWVSGMGPREYSKDIIKMYDTEGPDQRTSPTDVTGNESGDEMKGRVHWIVTKEGQSGQGRRENEPLEELLLEAGIRGDQSCVKEKLQKKTRYSLSSSGLNLRRNHRCKS